VIDREPYWVARADKAARALVAAPERIAAISLADPAAAHSGKGDRPKNNGEANGKTRQHGHLA
jgi:hypothetical protein